MLSCISFTFSKFISFLDRWQDLVGALIGAFSAFAVWWIAKRVDDKEKNIQNLVYLERLLVDQLNSVNEARNTLSLFIKGNLQELINNIGKNPPAAYSVDFTFVPLFPVRLIDEAVQRIQTKSGYIDNKIARAYKMSHELSHSIADMRRQFDETVETNKSISFNKLNNPVDQKQAYKRNIEGFRDLITRDILNKNFPIYLKVIAEARVALEEFSNLGKRKWRYKYDLRYKFYLTKADYLIAKEKFYKEMDNHFAPRVQELLRQLDNL